MKKRYLSIILITLVFGVVTAASVPVSGEFLQRYPQWTETLDKLSPAHQKALLGVIAAGQGERLLGEAPPSSREVLAAFCDALAEVDAAYAGEGGIVGYHRLCLAQLSSKATLADNCCFAMPPCTDFSGAPETTRKAAGDGLERLSEMAELYVVGGAADRLALIDPDTGSPLPGMCLPFCGHTLIDGLFRDLVAREYLAYKLTGEQAITPVVMMTSHQKGNHARLLEICERANYFARPKSELFFVTQPQVPVVSESGDWCSTGPLQLTLKPGGHGALWPTMERAGAFDWLAARGRRCVLVRQLNNPLLSLDDTLLAFYGVGIAGKKAFGYLSCQRELNEPIGIDVLCIRETSQGKEAALTCVEYTDTERLGFESESGKIYPGNLNLLFADLSILRPLLKSRPYPQLVMNLKHCFPSADSSGKVEEVRGGRLESLVQGVGELLFQPIPEDVSSEWLRDHLQSFVVQTQRAKTFSAIKRQRASAAVDGDTPEHAFYDLQKQYFGMFKGCCGFEIPPFPSLESYDRAGLPCVILYHPALGPLYSVIGQKIRGGSLAAGSFLRLEIAELDVEELKLQGGLEVIATAPLGPKDREGVLRFGDACGKCRLHRVRVVNEGLGENPGDLWKCHFSSVPALCIVIHGNGEFEAEDVCFRGDRTIVIPDGVLLRASMHGDELVFESRSLAAPSWRWNYVTDESGSIQLEQEVF